MKYEDLEPYILCKAAPVSEELQSRVLNGFKNVEIHLEPQFVTDEQAVANTFKTIMNSRLDVKGVHMPLIKGASPNTGVIEFCAGSTVEIFDNTLLLAQQLGEAFDHEIYVVYHAMLSAEALKLIKGVWDNILYYFDCRLKHYPRVVYMIENTTPLDETGVFVSGSWLENVSLCKTLRAEFGENKFFTTVDTCHAVTNQIISVSLYSKDLYVTPRYAYTLYQRNRPYVNNIHLSDVWNLGAKPEWHGIAHDFYRVGSGNRFNICMEYITSFTSDIPFVTLEVKEKDYNNPVKSIEQLNNIKRYFEESGGAYE